MEESEESEQVDVFETTLNSDSTTVEPIPSRTEFKIPQVPILPLVRSAVPIESDSESEYTREITQDYFASSISCLSETQALIGMNEQSVPKPTKTRVAKRVKILRSFYREPIDNANLTLDLLQSSPPLESQEDEAMDFSLTEEISKEGKYIKIHYSR